MEPATIYTYCVFTSQVAHNTESLVTHLLLQQLGICHTGICCKPHAQFWHQPPTSSTRENQSHTSKLKLQAFFATEADCQPKISALPARPQSLKKLV